jgi:hypothetical protein
MQAHTPTQLTISQNPKNRKKHNRRNQEANRRPQKRKMGNFV